MLKSVANYYLNHYYHICTTLVLIEYPLTSEGSYLVFRCRAGAREDLKTRNCGLWQLATRINQ